MLLAYRIVQVIIFLSSGIVLISLLRFIIVIKKSENKYVYEIEPHLNSILRLVIAGTVIITVFGVAGFILKAFIY